MSFAVFVPLHAPVRSARILTATDDNSIQRMVTRPTGPECPPRSVSEPMLSAADRLWSAGAFNPPGRRPSTERAAWPGPPHQGPNRQRYRRVWFRKYGGLRHPLR